MKKEMIYFQNLSDKIYISRLPKKNRFLVQIFIWRNSSNKNAIGAGDWLHQYPILLNSNSTEMQLV